MGTRHRRCSSIMRCESQPSATSSLIKQSDRNNADLIYRFPFPQENLMASTYKIYGKVSSDPQHIPDQEQAEKRSRLILYSIDRNSDLADALSIAIIPAKEEHIYVIYGLGSMSLLSCLLCTAS